MTKRSALTAADGAEFRGRIDQVEPGRFRASCFAELVLPHRIECEEPDHLICESGTVAKDWIKRQAGRHGFERFTLDPE